MGPKTPEGALPIGLPIQISLADLTRRLNRVATSRGSPPYTDRQTETFLRSGGVRVLQSGPGCKKFFLGSEIESEFPRFAEALLAAEESDAAVADVSEE